MEASIQLTAEQIAAMRAVKNGADVYAYHLAGALREVQKAAPHLIWIGKAANAPEDGAKQQPYFGAILTKEGKRVLRDCQAAAKARAA